MASIVASGLADLINRTVPGVSVEMSEAPAIIAIRDLDAGKAQFAITFNLLAFHAVKSGQLLGHRSEAIAALTARATCTPAFQESIRALSGL